MPQSRRSPIATDEICRLRTIHPAIRGVRLSRNFGQHVAITAGLAEAKGERVVVLDCDLQDPPSLIASLSAELDKGYDLVYARRIERTHSLFRQVATRTYFRFLAALTGVEVDGRFGSYSILSRKVVDAFLRFGERERHYLFILRWLGFSAGVIDYVQQPRHAGKSSYTLGRLLALSLDGILFQTTRLLRWIVGLGLAFGAAGVLVALYLVWRVLFRTALPGWTSLAVLILVSTGVILASVGVIGLYIGKVFAQAKQRPLYVIDTMIDGRAK
jgi:dolichol-phosphate mannosyltransferase